jgi:hypothetical protein
MVGVTFPTGDRPNRGWVGSQVLETVSHMDADEENMRALNHKATENSKRYENDW